MIPPLLLPAVAFAAGIFLALFTSVPAVIPVVMGLGAAALAWRARRSPRRATACVLIVWLSVGLLRTLSVRALPTDHLAWLLGPEPAAVALHGVVVNDPVELFSPDDDGSVAATRLACVVEAREVQRQGVGWQPVRGRVRATIHQPRAPLAVGDEVLLEGRWSRAPGPGNPGQYDWRAALARQQIHALLTVEPFEAAVRLRAARGWWWARGIAAVRHRAERLLDASFREADAGLLRAFLLGERVALPARLKRAFVETGTMHLVVVSGFNVGLIALLLELGLRLAGAPLRGRLVATAIGVGGYCWLAGLQPPVVRATIMAWMVLGALWLDRVVNWPNLLAAAALLMLWLNPLQLTDPSFQLSVGAVASLLLFAHRFREAIEPRLSRLPMWPHHLSPPPKTALRDAQGPAGQRQVVGWLRRAVAVSLASTLAIWVGLWPLLAWYFHLVSPISVLANLVLVPLVSAMVMVGTPLLALGLLLPEAMRWGAPPVAWLIHAIVACVGWLHRVPAGSWEIGTPSGWLIGGYCFLVGLSLLRRRLRCPPIWVLAAWLLGLNVWLWTSLAIRQVQARWLEMTVLDVGHGDSLVLRTPTRQTVVIDAGTPEAGQYAVVPFLRARGWSTVDALLLTHPDADHVGGALAVLDQVRVKRVFTNGSLGESALGRQVLALAAQQHIPQERLVAGTQLTGVSGVEMIILHPPREGVPGAAGRSNDNSVVLKVTKGGVSFLLCGDLEEQGVPWVLQWGDAVRATILKVPHHGSALGAAMQAFFERVHPEVSILSVGTLHRLPSSEVVHALARVGTQLYLTRRDGAVTVRTDGTRLFVKTFKE